MNNAYKGIVNLESDDQFKTLMTSGSVTLSSGEVVTYSPNDTTYYTPVVDSELNYYEAGAVATSGDKYNIAIGDQAKPMGTGNIVIGASAQNQISSNSNIIIGGYSSSVSNNTIAIGHNARTEADGAFQLGAGTNETADTLQIKSDNIYNATTHTLTVNNAQVNGKDVYGVTKKQFTNASISAIFNDSSIDLSKIKEITLKFRNDTNMKGASFEVHTSTTGQTIKEFSNSDSALIVVANEIHHFVKSYNYESNYEFVSGNYKLAKNGNAIPVVSYYGVQYTTDDGDAAQWYQAKTVADFNVDATIIME